MSGNSGRAGRREWGWKLVGGKYLRKGGEKKEVQLDFMEGGEMPFLLII